jgi:esterase/lipase
MGCLGDAEAAIAKAQKFSLESVADKVTMPFLVVHGADDKVVPVAAAQKLYQELGSQEKELKIFTADEGASGHCCVDNRPAGVDYIADWIATTLERRGQASRTVHPQETR